jgi:ABC-2 type transport system ATP-binding protein
VQSVDLRNGQLLVALREGVTDYTDLPTCLIQNGLRLMEFRPDEINLEAAFMALTNRMSDPDEGGRKP